MLCCCGLSRRQLLRGALASGAALAAGCARPSAEQQRTARLLVQDTLSVDLHSHPGMLRGSRLTTDQHLQKLAGGRVNVALFAAVADGPLLTYRFGRGIYATRSPRPGELFDGFIGEIMRLVDVVGVDHVAIGTDMDGVVRQSIIFDDYAAWPSIPASLLARGVSADDVAKILGGNFRRVFREVTGA